VSTSLAYEATVTIISCGQCGAPIALANEASLLKTHATFYCPNGHPRAFTGETAEAKKSRELQAQLQRETQRREMAEREVTQERKRAENAERKVKRASKGLCTCCNRSFVNLQHHMATQHPAEVKS
jgi:hypothetical protein